jgi:hypothetical protein
MDQRNLCAMPGGGYGGAHTGHAASHNDDIVRFLVPEVNTGSDDLESIMLDLSKAFY